METTLCLSSLQDQISFTSFYNELAIALTARLIATIRTDFFHTFILV